MTTVFFLTLFMQTSARKKGLLVLSLAALSLIAFSACSTEGTASADPAAKTVGSTPNVPDSTSPEVNGASTSGVANIVPAAENGATQVSDDVKNLLANQDQLNLLVEKGDVAGCKGLTMAQFQVSCETNILANKAKSNQDLSVCDTASTAEIKTQCQGLVAKK